MDGWIVGKNNGLMSGQNLKGKKPRVKKYFFAIRLGGPRFKFTPLTESAVHQRGSPSLTVSSFAK